MAEDLSSLVRPSSPNRESQKPLGINLVAKECAFPIILLKFIPFRESRGTLPEASRSLLVPIFSVLKHSPGPLDLGLK
jgi:hypothetical protein